MLFRSDTRPGYGAHAAVNHVHDLLAGPRIQSRFLHVVWGGEAREIDPDPVEVAKVFRIPLTELDSPAIPRLTPSADRQQPVMSAPLPTTGGVVYAPTAALLYQFREVAMHGRSTRVAHFDQPKFAWR